ncbi:AraC family transcriptional regulator [Pseudomonas alkylphenolica]|uniref:AraC family transcriptional regulator n=1 Tax=Pseudomonas alkylphenolica TaxID=237609 RepID=A0A077FA46_9PSED|nr:AraC family transcriptional regulator [Pseudomonas alkylphenolica]
MTTLDPALEQQRQELADLVRRHAPRSISVESAIDDLYLVQYEESVRSMPALAQPALCILAHGSKEICLGDERYVYDPLHYMVLSVALPAWLTDECCVAAAVTLSQGTIQYSPSARGTHTSRRCRLKRTGKGISRNRPWIKNKIGRAIIIAPAIKIF